MTCRQEIEFSFRAKSRSALLDYVCNRIDENDRDIIEMWDCIGKLLAYVESKQFSSQFQCIQNENEVRENIQNMLKTSKWYCVEHYKDNWKARFSNEKGDADEKE